MRAFGGVTVGPVGYSVIGAAFSDPFVGDGSDPTTNPFACEDPELAGFYCYPGDIISPDPFLWDDFLNSLPDPPPELGLHELVNLLLGDWWSWLWNQTGENGPPLAVNDSFGPPAAGQGASFTSPVSVLLNDIEPDGDPMVALLSGPPPAGGTVTLNPDGTFAYSGNAGEVQFTYVAYDFRHESTPATVTFIADTALAGDFNQDGVVDGADYVVWRKGLGTTYDQEDFQVWRSNFGATSSPAMLTGGSGSVVVGNDTEQGHNSQTNVKTIAEATAAPDTFAHPEAVRQAPVEFIPPHRPTTLGVKTERSRQASSSAQLQAHVNKVSLLLHRERTDYDQRERLQVRDAAFERYADEQVTTKLPTKTSISIGKWWSVLSEMR
jgi:hypothetical protein